MVNSNSFNQQNPASKVSVWSVDRIGRLIVGVINLALLIAVVQISSYFIIGICLLNLNLVFTSLTDHCPMRNLLKRLGAKERENYFNANGELKQSRVSRTFSSELSDVKNS